jgi:hypothetical protein
MFVGSAFPGKIMRSFLCGAILVFACLGAAFGQETNFSRGPQYLMNGSPLFARSLATPSISLAGPPLEVGAANATADLIAGAEMQTTVPPSPDAFPVADLYPIYYGVAPVQLVEIDSSQEAVSRADLAARRLSTGVGRLTTPQELRRLGYGMTLGEAAVYSKSQARHAARIYTNADIERLHGG